MAVPARMGEAAEIPAEEDRAEAVLPGEVPAENRRTAAVRKDSPAETAAVRKDNPAATTAAAVRKDSPAEATAAARKDSPAEAAAAAKMRGIPAATVTAAVKKTGGNVRESTKGKAVTSPEWFPLHGRSTRDFPEGTAETGITVSHRN